jgi:aromatic-L-amino-acid/L-tryptophan decarboxylase
VLPQPTIERDDDAAADPLALDPETMRRLGHETVDLLVAMLHDPEAPALRRASPAEMRRRIAPHAPEAPGDFEALLAQLRDDVFAHMSRLDHPRYFAFIPACGTWPSALGDFLASAMNVYGGSWMEAAGPSRPELVVLDWFKEWIGYPKDADGVLVSGASAANMTALACAREALAGAMPDRLVANVSDQAHCSLARTARLLGFAPNQLRVLPTDDRFRLRPDALEAAIGRASGSRAAGTPAASFFVVVRGSADVERDGEQVGELTAGSFFGELAAMDWGRATAIRGWRP